MYNKTLQSKLLGYATSKLGMEDYTKGWMKGDCPICGKSFKFGIHIGMNKAHCFSCDYRSRLIPLVQEIEGIQTFQDTLKFLKTFEGIEYVEPLAEIQKEYGKVEFPEDYRLIGINEGRKERDVKAYLKGRGFKIKRLMRAGWGYCIHGKYGGRLIIPYFQNGELVYFTARKLIDFGPKFLNIPDDDAGVGKSQLIYNIDALAMYRKVYVVESATNSETMGEMGTGYGGKVLSRYQKSCILSSRVEEVIIGLDPDAYYEALKLGLELAHHKKVKVLKLPDDTDINTLGKKEVKRIEMDTPWQSYRDIFRLWNDEKSKGSHHA